MPRARTSYPPNRQAVASAQESGCLSGFLIPPLTVILFGLLLALLTRGLHTSVRAESMPTGITQESLPAADFEGGISPIFRPEVQYWGEAIVRWSAAADLDPNLAAVVMQIESCGDPRATSSAGAAGLFQVMPYHFETGENPYQADTNALRGLGYLKRSLDSAGGDARLAMAGYNGGIGIINRGEWAWAAETIRYVKYGGPIYEDARMGAASSAMLDEWYNHYGANLCRQAAQRLGLY